jgi:hypothetical protein
VVVAAVVDAPESVPLVAPLSSPQPPVTRSAAAQRAEPRAHEAFRMIADASASRRRRVQAVLQRRRGAARPRDGASIAVGGFGLCGNPEACIAAIAASGARGLTIVSNNCGNQGQGLAILLQQRQVARGGLQLRRRQPGSRAADAGG